MPRAYRIAVRTTRGENRGRYKVTLTAKEGTYALSIPQTVFGKFMYQIVKKKPLTIDFKSAVPVEINFKGIRPLGKTARKSLKYVPLRPRPPKENEKEQKNKKNVSATVPQMSEITSALFDDANAGAKSTKKTKKNANAGAKSTKKGRKQKDKKQAVASAV
jgi:hypothetical protein